MANALARRYATALFEIANRQGAVATVDADLQFLAQAVGDPEIRVLALQADTPTRVRRQVLERLVRDAHELVRNLVQVLLERRREAAIDGLHEAFHALVLEARDEVEGVVETPHTLDASTLEALATSVGRQIGKRVTLVPRHTPDLIGGVRVRVGNTLYDGSVASALDELRWKMLVAPLP